VSGLFGIATMVREIYEFHHVTMFKIYRLHYLPLLALLLVRRRPKVSCIKILLGGGGYSHGNSLLPWFHIHHAMVSYMM
jgi:hypothetical protein